MNKTTLFTAIAALLLAGNANAAKYIVSYDASRADKVRSAVEKAGGEITKQFEIINAFVAELPDTSGAVKISKTKGVQAVEEDKVINWLAGEAENMRSSAELPSLTEVIANVAEKQAESASSIPAVSPAAEISSSENNSISSLRSEIPWGIARVNASAAWAFTEGAGVKVAVVDTGINYNHKDLADNYAGGYNAINPSATPLDDQGHGTHVAGTIAAVKNGTGVVGVAPKAKLYAVKVLGGDGSGSYSSIISGIEWAVKQKVNVINMSLGGGGYMAAMHNAIKEAVNENITVVCAAGNDSGPVNYPAKYPEAIAVSASNSYDGIAYFSSRGDEIEYIAPGVDIQSTSMRGGYEKMSGTSMACPHVAGLAALAYGAGHTTPADVRAAFNKAAEKLGTLSSQLQGAGLVNAAKLK